MHYYFIIIDKLLLIVQKIKSQENELKFRIMMFNSRYTGTVKILTAFRSSTKVKGMKERFFFLRWLINSFSHDTSMRIFIVSQYVKLMA